MRCPDCGQNHETCDRIAAFCADLVAAGHDTRDILRALGSHVALMIGTVGNPKERRAEVADFAKSLRAATEMAAASYDKQGLTAETPRVH